MEALGLGSAARLLQLYDARAQCAVNRFTESLPPLAQGRAAATVIDGAAAAEHFWRQCKNGADETEGGPGNIEVAQSALGQLGSVGAGLVADAGAEDLEHPYGRQAGPQVQRALAQIIDECPAEGLRLHFEAAGATGAFSAKRLSDLADASVDHCWLWGTAAAHGGILDDHEEFIEAVRVRLGTGGPGEATLCQCCGEHVLDPSGRHASTCALGEATRGHNGIKNVLFAYAQIADPQSELEPTHVIASRPQDRPADILSAATGRLSALDVGVTSLAVGSSGGAAAETMWCRKLLERQPFEAELAASGIEYVPLILTHFGLLHPKTDGALSAVARHVSRRRGVAKKAVERQLRARIGAAIARRAARMSLATWKRTMLLRTSTWGRRTSATSFVRPPRPYELVQRLFVLCSTFLLCVFCRFFVNNIVSLMFRVVYF
jgi:hypothetical protein